MVEVIEVAFLVLVVMVLIVQYTRCWSYLWCRWCPWQCQWRCSCGARGGARGGVRGGGSRGTQDARGYDNKEDGDVGHESANSDINWGC